MPSVQIYSVRPMPAFILILAVLIATGGCATSPPRQPGPDLAPAPLPKYKEGTTYVYSNGSWERVIGIRPDAVTWENHQGTVSTGPTDFTYKKTSWESRSGQGEREFAPREDVLTTPPTSLWPLRVGNVAGHSEWGRWSEKGGPEKTYRAKWRCEVTGTETLSVMAGEFDTYKIDCARKSGKRTWELKSWNYAPSVGHYVRVNSRYTYDRPSWQKELLAIIPPDDGLSIAKRNHIEKGFQKTLENNQSGRPFSWSDKIIRVEIMPVDTFRIDNGAYCRRYVQKISQPNDKETYFGMACRETNGTWVIPRK